jgi:transcriptional regulator with PAS, ATPase and Fis domain
MNDPILAIKNEIASRGSVCCSTRGREDDKRMVTSDKKMLSILRLAKEVAPSRATVLIMGETGTGKEMLARYIHAHSKRNKSHLIAVNCAALPETLAESELFGHEKGAFTGAVNRKIGKFEIAHEGTLLLDEIGELPLSMQAKLLRVLQERAVDRVGGKIPVPVDIRIIAVSNVDLEKSVIEGSFREDLFYRLNVIPITLPPLRHRKGDIALLIEYFLKKFRKVYHKNSSTFSESAIKALNNRPWGGNVRELENLVERFVLTGNQDFLKCKDSLSKWYDNKSGADLNLSENLSIKHMEKCLIEKALGRLNGNRTHAAQQLGISVRTLRNKLKEYRLETT